MEGGNGATSGSGITHSPTGEQNDEKFLNAPLKSHAETRRRGGGSRSFKQTRSVQLEPRSGSIFLAVGETHGKREK